MVNTKRLFNYYKKTNVAFYLLESIVTNIMVWKCFLDESTKNRYDMILRIYLLIMFKFDIKCTKNVISGVP